MIERKIYLLPGFSVDLQKDSALFEMKNIVVYGAFQEIFKTTHPGVIFIN